MIGVGAGKVALGVDALGSGGCCRMGATQAASKQMDALSNANVRVVIVTLS